MNKTIETILLWIAGLALLIFGLNKFFFFIPSPPMPPSDMKTFFDGFMASRYLMPLVGVVETLVGLLFLTKKYVPFALVLLAPISVNIVLIHLFLDPKNVGPALLVFTINVVLMWKYRDKYRPMFS